MALLSWRVTEILRYRFARPDEIPAIARLVAHSFPGPNRSAAVWEEQLRDPVQGGGAETLLVAEDTGRHAASLQLYPLRQWIGGQALSIAGVGMVTVSPAHRKRGLAAQLMTRALRAARERGDSASALYPFRVSFYQKLGYGHAGMALQYQVPPSALPDSPERTQVELLDHDNAYREALELYHRWVRAQTGQLERSERLWTQLCTAQDRALVGYRARGGALEGYALVVYRTDLPRAQRYLEVDELVWTSLAARRGLYAWLASLGDQWEQVLLRALPSHQLVDWIREPRLPHAAAPGWGLWAPAATLMMGPMFRLLDLRRAWEQRQVIATPPFVIAFNVVDEQLEENCGRWRLAFDDTRVTIDQQASADVEIGLNTSTLSRLYIGSLTPRAGLEAGLLDCSRPELLDRLGVALALPEAWTFDRF
jgi:predicted acetyltransferase